MKKIATKVVKANSGIIETSHDASIDTGGGNLEDADALVTTLSLPEGNWFVQAKMGVVAPSVIFTTCRLEVGANTDEFTQRTAPSSGDAKDVGVLNVSTSLASPASAVLRCSDFAGPATFATIDHVHLTAIEAPSLSSATF